MELKELPAIEAPGIKDATLMHQDNGLAVLTCVYDDGVISSCSGRIENKEFKPESCYSSEPGQEGAYFPWIAHLAAVGYKEQHIPVEKGAALPSGIKERLITNGITYGV